VSNCQFLNDPTLFSDADKLFTYSKGGFVNLQSYTISIDTCSFQYGFGLTGGAIFLIPLEITAVNIAACEFTANIAEISSASGNGGAIYFDLSNLQSGDISINSLSVFENNKAFKGGAMYFTVAPIDVNILIQEVSFVDNYAIR